MVSPIHPASVVELRCSSSGAITLNSSVLLWIVLFSSVGLGFFMYGRKQKAVIPLVCGLALMIYPYFVSDIIAVIAIGVGLIAIPYFVRY